LPHRLGRVCASGGVGLLSPEPCGKLSRMVSTRSVLPGRRPDEPIDNRATFQLYAKSGAM